MCTFNVNCIIGLILLAVLVYALLKLVGVLPDWMPALPLGRSRGAWLPASAEPQA